MSNEIPNSSDKLIPRYGRFLWAFDNPREDASGWVIYAVNIKLIDGDYGIVLKRANVDTGAREVLFAYAGTLSGAMSKAEAALKEEKPKWRADRF